MSNSSAPLRTALVTGANRGIGLEVCKQLAQLGYRVLLTSRDAAKGAAAAASLQTAGEVHFHPLEVTDPASIAQLHATVVRLYGTLDVLINNAAILLDDAQVIWQVSPAVFRTTFETNLIGPLALCQTFVPLMRAQGYGRVVNVSSEMGQWAYLDGGTPAYSLSKTALNGLTLMLAHQLRGTNVLVNAVCPGWVRTDMGGPNATRSVAEGADSIVWLATLPDNGPQGGFFQNREPLEW